MTCEREEQQLQGALDSLEWQKAECAGLPEGSPDKLACRGSIAIAEALVEDTRKSLAECRKPHLRHAAGYLRMLRVHERNSGYGGGASNHIKADVIFTLEDVSDKAFGFFLRRDDNLPIREGMLALLRDAFVNGFRVNLDYLEADEPPNQNCLAVRIWLERKQAGQPITDLDLPSIARS